MAYSYEVSVSAAHRELFEQTFLRHVEALDFAHMHVSGLMGGATSHEFRRVDDLISLTILAEGQHRFRLVVQSETVPVEPLIVEVLIEDVAESLKPFLGALQGASRERVLRSLIERLREKLEAGPVQEE